MRDGIGHGASPGGAARPGRAALVMMFLYLWGTLGFAIGTLTLLGPVRWVTAALRARDAGQSAEDWAVRLIIVLLVLVTGTLAWLLARRAAAARGWRRAAMPAATTLLAAGALALWLNPRFVAGAAQFSAAGGRFVFGPYPLEDDLRRLKAEGYDGVVTLLHPAVAPFEPKLLADERAAARDVGIPLIEAPMLPWISSNEDALATVRRLAQSGRGRYYVHCYLGKDRVNVVRRVVTEAAGESAVAGGGAPANARRLADVKRLERGTVYHLRDSVYAGPFPTDEEWIGYVLNGTVRAVVSLLDPSVPGDTAWIAREDALARTYRITVTRLPLRSFPWDPQTALTAATRARALPKPLFVHAYRADRARLQGFVQAYETGLPPLPPSLFEEPMTGGSVDVVGPNFAVGPRPAGPEFGSYLAQRGVRHFVYLGAPQDAAARADRAVVQAAGFSYRVMSPSDPGLARLLAGGGPWYLYGPGLASVRRELDARFHSGVY